MNAVLERDVVAMGEALGEDDDAVHVTLSRETVVWLSELMEVKALSARCRHFAVLRRTFAG